MFFILNLVFISGTTSDMTKLDKEVKYDGHSQNINSNESNTTNYTCTVCNVHSIPISDLQKHQKKEHPGIGYNYVISDKRFPNKQKGSWSVNLIHHLGEKPSGKKCYRKARYSCRFCGKLYFHKQSFRQHEKSHTNFNRYSCELCGETFSRKRYCTHHIRLHTQSYSCRVCKKSFTCNYTTRKRDICNVCRKRNFFECVQKIKTQSASSLICMKTKSVRDHRESDQDKISKFSNPINKMEAKCYDTNKYEEEDKTSNFGDDEQIENQHQSEYFSC